MNSFINEVCVKWRKEIDDKILGEIKQKAIENGIKTEYLLNEKAIINALEKQIPKKPITDKERMITIYRCGCGKHLVTLCDKDIIVGTIQNYCSNCGQALDWSDTE